MAIELKNRIELELKVRIPIVIFLQGPSIEQFATQVLRQITTIAPEPSADRDAENLQTFRISAPSILFLLVLQKLFPFSLKLFPRCPGKNRWSWVFLARGDQEEDSFAEVRNAVRREVAE